MRRDKAACLIPQAALPVSIPVLSHMRFISEVIPVSLWFEAVLLKL